MKLMSSLGFLTSLILAVGCGSSGGDDDGDDSGGPDAGGDSGPLYVGSTRVFTADSSVGYLFTTPSIDAAATIDLADAIEIEDAWVFGAADPYFYTATIFGPTITRWELGAGGELVEGPTVSFANAGVTGTYIAATTPMFSSTKSYFVDAGSSQLVIWNPTEMTVLGTVPIELPVLDGMTAFLDLAVTPERLYVSAFWMSQASGWTAYGDHVRLIAIDPATDEVVATTDDDRCETGAPAGVASDGAVYFSPWDYHTAVREVFGAGYGAGSCGLRVVAAADGFDAGYEVDLSALVGGRPAGGVTLIGGDDALIHVWNQDLVPATPATWGDDRWAAGYTWWRWHLGDAEAVELPAQQPSAEGGGWRELDGAIYTYNPNAEYSATTMFELAVDNTLVERLTIPGWTIGLVRAR